MINWASFGYGILFMSAFTATMLILFDNCKEDDMYFQLAGGPILWIVCGIFWIIRTVRNKWSYYGTKSVFTDKDGQLWYCDRKWNDLVTEFGDDYEEPDIIKYQGFTKFWRNRVWYENGKYYSVNFRYAPKKFWKTLAKPIPQEEIWKMQMKEQAYHPNSL